MTIIQLKNINKSFIDKKIIENGNLTIHQNEKIGLIGENGSGKSTLAKILVGELLPDSGSIYRNPKNLHIGYLAQTTDSTITSISFTKKEEIQLAKQMGFTHLAKENISSGESMKVALASIWAKNPELLILDEPTNHMDSQGINWLVNEISSFRGTVIIISHDRHFLDQTVTRIVEVEHHSLYDYNGNYSEYKIEKSKKYELQLHHYENQQKLVRGIEGQIQNLRQWSQQAHQKAGKVGSKSENKQMGLREFERKKAKKRDQQIKSKIKMLTKELEAATLLRPKEENSVFFSFTENGRKGKRVLEANKLTLGYNCLPLVNNCSFYITYGEKVALIGSNGAGKSTLLKTITGEIDAISGELWRGPSLKFGFLSQLHDWNSSSEKTIMEYLSFSSTDEKTRARTLLVNIGLHRDMHQKQMCHLSPGEKTRVEIVKMIMEQYDLLILDEPTNHLDIKSREMLEKTLQSFEGTLIVVSHDRHLVSHVCKSLLVIEQQQIKKYNMTLDEYYKRSLASPTDKKEELMRIQNQLDYIIGKLSIITSADPDYQILDKEFHFLLSKKKSLERS